MLDAEPLRDLVEGKAGAKGRGKAQILRAPPEQALLREQAAGEIAVVQKDRRLALWVRVHLGGRRRVEAAREMGYKDGSAATQIMKRLTARAAKNPPTAAQLCQLEQELQKKLSSVKR